MASYIVVDASVFIVGKELKGELITVPSVKKELRDIRSKSRLEIYGVHVESPSKEALGKAESAAKETGDYLALSKADLELLAKAQEYGAILATDDYALQNVALHLGLQIEPLEQPIIKRLKQRVKRCSACGAVVEKEACPDCGTISHKKKGRCLR